MGTEERFGPFLRRVRTEKGLTMGDVARALEVSVVYVSDVERSRRDPFVKEKMVKVAALLGIDIATLETKAALARGKVSLPMKKVPARAREAAVALGRGDFPSAFWDDFVELTKKYEEA